MKRYKQVACALVVISMALISDAPDALARAVPGDGGKAAGASQEGCFQNVWNTVNQTCAGLQYYIYPLPVDSAGTKQVKVWGSTQTIDAGNPTGCRAVGMSPTGSTWIGDLYGPSTARAIQEFDPSSVQIASYGTLNLLCQLQQNASIYSVVWNQ